MEKRANGAKHVARQGIWFKNGASQAEIDSFKIEEPTEDTEEGGDNQDSSSGDDGA